MYELKLPFKFTKIIEYMYNKSLPIHNSITVKIMKYKKTLHYLRVTSKCGI